MFFRILAEHPARFAVAAGAPRVLDASAICITPVMVGDYDHSTRAVKVFFEDREGRGFLEPQILTASFLTVSDFATMRIWEHSTGDVEYDLCTVVPQELRGKVQEVLGGIIKASCVCT